jgi:hypothetical protein
VPLVAEVLLAQLEIMVLAVVVAMVQVSKV